jgi:hypothetical protein
MDLEAILENDRRYRSNLRCTNTRCGSYAKRLALELGQDDNGVRGLEYAHRCHECGGSVASPRTPVDALTQSETVARILRHRLDGWVIPLLVDTTPFPPSELDAEPAGVSS